jgi:hypothetical protein
MCSKPLIEEGICGSAEGKKIPKIHAIKGSQYRRNLFAITEIVVKYQYIDASFLNSFMDDPNLYNFSDVNTRPHFILKCSFDLRFFNLVWKLREREGHPVLVESQIS